MTAGNPESWYKGGRSWLRGPCWKSAERNFIKLNVHTWHPLPPLFFVVLVAVYLGIRIIPRPLFPVLEMKAALVLAGLAATAAASTQCRSLPGDASWPGDFAWSLLNMTVRGQLVQTVPLGSVCHDPTYDAAACAALQQTWAQPVTQFVLPALVLISCLTRVTA